MNKDIETNIELQRILREWDPFKVGAGFYDTEAADAIQAVHQTDNPGQLASKIQEIYEFSFEEKVPLSSCKEVALRLLHIKNNAACEL
ncbi:DUF1871 family protein [Bacillus thermotolerans]|uniref:DUF1871 family protein n=1 Tax=Bacillus thermotolerans TaxID=1221996 RepID=UPI00057FC24E|nr:DUF1871 family protein [Bacillus thermotolerans]KKB34972.1 hypothetical protein QY97_02029 [Bacillus thermotolerans]KKB40586.1 hypothetical protein QY96_02322 [Bacillus thermotolerans]